MSNIRKSLDDVIGKVTIFDEDDLEWKLEDIAPDAPSDIRRTLTEHLKQLKKEVPKPKFGDQTSIENALYNKVIDDLVMDISEGR